MDDIEEYAHHAKPLDDRERIFVDTYLADLQLNAAAAARAAGYADTTANTASAWIGRRRTSCPAGKRHVWDHVKQALADRARDHKLDAKFVLNRLAQIVDADPLDIIDEDTGAYLPVHDWPLVWRRMLTGADIQELHELDAAGRRHKIGEIVKYRFPDRLKAFELLGKHVDIQAFKDQVKTEGTIQITIDSQDAKL